MCIEVLAGASSLGILRGLGSRHAVYGSSLFGMIINSFVHRR